VEDSLSKILKGVSVFKKAMLLVFRDMTKNKMEIAIDKRARTRKTRLRAFIQGLQFNE
jgi:hypothetical protein